MKRILVTGGAGFIGSHLVDVLIQDGSHVTALDNFSTGKFENIRHLLSHPQFCLIEADIASLQLNKLTNILFDEIYHLACPASPLHYQLNPIGTLQTCFLGTMNVLDLAVIQRSKVLIASTSGIFLLFFPACSFLEVYGDPEEHPQSETYWGHVNPIGPRSCYDEGKRVAEALAVAYHRKHGISIRIARIFNTYGPRMSIDDGRVVSSFIVSALKGQNLLIFGDGNQTRSFQYISDLLDALLLLMGSLVTSPVNLGNPEEFTINEFANLVLNLTGSTANKQYTKPLDDDPYRRKPDISKARIHLGWEPKVKLKEGIIKTIEFYKGQLN